MKSCPWMRPAAGESGIVAASRFNIQRASSAGGATTAGLGGFTGVGCPPVALATGPACWLVDLKIFPWNANSPTAATQNKTIKIMAGPGKLFSGMGAGAAPAFATAAGTGRSPTFVPVMMNLGSSVAGAWGATIFWKNVGHSIVVPLCVESHLMCWPHTGQAYVNSLMVSSKNIPYSPAGSNEVF